MYKLEYVSSKVPELYKVFKVKTVLLCNNQIFSANNIVKVTSQKETNRIKKHIFTL